MKNLKFDWSSYKNLCSTWIAIVCISLFIVSVIASFFCTSCIYIAIPWLVASGTSVLCMVFEKESVESRLKIAMAAEDMAIQKDEWQMEKNAFQYQIKTLHDSLESADKNIDATTNTITQLREDCNKAVAMLDAYKIDTENNLTDLTTQYKNLLSEQKDINEKLKSTIKIKEKNLNNKLLKRDMEIAEMMGHSYIIEDSDHKYYQHYKGGVYRQIATAIDTDSSKEEGREMIVYASMINDQVYTRSLVKFHSSISAKAAKAMGIKFKVGDTLPPRFQEISKEEAEELAANYECPNHKHEKQENSNEAEA